jgi:hypothetical protein
MGKSTLDDHVRQYYERQRLSPASLHSLKTLIRSGNSIQKSGTPARRRRILSAAAVLLTILSAAIWFSSSVTTTPQRPAEIAAVIAQQAALGHNERQELEFRVSRCEQLREQMKSLDFTPVEPEMMRKMNMRIVGARYTTIEGGMAAQMLYVDAKGVPCTLYEVRPTEKLARVPAGERDVDGVKVSMWREKGLLMVLARPIA